MQFNSIRYICLSLLFLCLNFHMLVLFCAFCNPTLLQTLKFKGMSSQIISCVSILENTVESHGFRGKKCPWHKITTRKLNDAYKIKSSFQRQ